MRSLVIQKGLRVNLLILHFKRSQLKWFGHLIRMPPGCILGEVFWACPTRRRPPVRPRICWRDYTSWLTWQQLEGVVRVMEVEPSLLRLLPL